MRLFLLTKVLSKKEKTALLLAFAALIIILIIKGVYLYRNLTVEVPAEGGSFSEAVIGQPEFLNPILAQSVGDQTICSLIYQGLISLDNKNQASPLAANSWQISADQKEYTFHLNPALTWHDGKPFSSDDVVYTFNTIKNPDEKSPYYNNFKDVEISAPDAYTAKFVLKTPYGPFLNNLNIGLIPAGRSLADLGAKPDGLGPYRYINSVTKRGKVEKLMLERFDNYSGLKPYLKKIEFKYYDNLKTAGEFFDQEEVEAIISDKFRTKAESFKYQTSAKMLLIFNLRKEPFNKAEFRQAVKNNQKQENKLSFEVIVSDNSELVKSADDLKEKLRADNVEMIVTVLKDNDYKERVGKHDFQAVVAGIDFGHDFDPYPLWHSSQNEGGLNMAGFSDKGIDILLEDARLLADPLARQAKYDQVEKTLDDQAVRLVLKTGELNYHIDDDYKNVSLNGALTPAEHLRNIAGWYVKTKRVRK